MLILEESGQYIKHMNIPRHNSQGSQFLKQYKSQARISLLVT